MSIKIILLSTAILGFVATSVLAMDKEKIQDHINVSQLLVFQQLDAPRDNKQVRYISTLKRLQAVPYFFHDGDQIMQKIRDGNFAICPSHGDEKGIIIVDTDNCAYRGTAQALYNNDLWFWRKL